MGRRLWENFDKQDFVAVQPATPNQPAARRSSKGRPNILFLMADDWSWPHAGAYGAPVVKTPTFDRVAREGVLFANAYVSSPSCTPSRMSIASGQWHWRLKDAANLGGSLAIDVKVYPELLEDAGYKIGHARKGAGPSKHEFTGRDPFGPKYKSFEAFFEQRDKDQPFCFWYGAGEPHRPYLLGEGAKSGMDLAQLKLPACLPDNDTTRNDFADYLHRIQMYDTFCGRALALLEKADVLENTIVVMAGDNGLPFPRCKATLYDTGTHVPLAIRWGTQVPGKRTVADFVSLTDLAPTFLEAAGLTPSAEMTGRSLLSTLRSERSGQVDPARNFVLAGMERHVYRNPCRAIRTADFLYIHNFNPDQWPTGDTGKPQPEIDFTTKVWPTFPGAFSYNIDPSPTKTFLLEHRDEEGIKPFFDLACGQRGAEEFYDLKADPAETKERLRGSRIRAGEGRIEGQADGPTTHITRPAVFEVGPPPKELRLPFQVANRPSVSARLRLMLATFSSCFSSLRLPSSSKASNARGTATWSGNTITPMLLRIERT